ncbi:hypothetical protein AAFH68_33220 [Flavobacterium sp. CGRL1]
MKNKNPETEQESLYKDLDQMSVKELLTNINTEDKKVPHIIEEQIPKIEKLVKAIVKKNAAWRPIILYWSRNFGTYWNFRCIRMSAYFWRTA